MTGPGHVDALVIDGGTGTVTVLVTTVGVATVSIGTVSVGTVSVGTVAAETVADEVGAEACGDPPVVPPHAVSAITDATATINEVRTLMTPPPLDHLVSGVSRPFQNRYLTYRICPDRAHDRVDSIVESKSPEMVLDMNQLRS
ncbi:hypothetical protein GCM10007304_10090 [Rhodococcoides trifolii]|uniref:Uncharacterized protein n=1 Tax=Rhodococcoides trifolii TaxID=908250 RepID=A0A917CTX6_9NOCA|nr:hypothetical protein GCM10007304_10090 [Rhodococcus trifolii]